MMNILILLYGIRWCGIGLTFDDGPVKQSFALVEYLHSEHIPAMFFPTGIRQEKYPGFVLFATSRGFTFGNHTYSHAELPTLTLKDVDREIVLQHELLVSQGATDPTWFRYPSGRKSKKAIPVLSRLRYQGIAGWDIFSGDIFGRGPESVFRRTRSALSTQPSAVVLFHDCSPGVVTRIKKFVTLVKQHNSEVNLLSKNVFFMILVPPETLFRRSSNEFDY